MLERGLGCARGVVGGGAVRGGGGLLLSSLDARPAAAQTAGERWPDGQGVYGTPGDCPVGFEVLFGYKKALRDFKKSFNAAVPEGDRGTAAELVVSAGEKKRGVDRSLCVRDVPPCPESVFRAGRTPPVYMADPADPLFERRVLDANFAARGQHVVDFGADFNAAWEAQTEDLGMGYRLSSNPKYWVEAAPGRAGPFTNEDTEVGDHEPFEDMHPDRCVDAVAEPDPPVVPSDYSECEAMTADVVPAGHGAPAYLPWAKDAFVFATSAEPPVNMCVRFARKACPPGTLLTDVAQRFKPGTVPGDETDPDSADPAEQQVPEEVTQRRCRSLVRRGWTCPVGHEPLNRFNRCSRPPPAPAAGSSAAPCAETGGTPEREQAFRGFFGAADCDDYVRGGFAAAPAACSSFGFADVSAAGLNPGSDYPNDPYKKLSGYLADASLTVLSEVDTGVDHWCKFKAGLLRGDCHGDKRPGKLDGCDEDAMKQESVCLITRSDIGGCAGIVHAVECLAVAAAIAAADELSDLGKALRDWQDYRQCPPCTDSPFDNGPAKGCEAPTGSSAQDPDEQVKTWLKDFIDGQKPGSNTGLRQSERLQGALFNRGKDDDLPPLGYPAADRPPCPNNKYNQWNLPSIDAVNAVRLEWFGRGTLDGRLEAEFREWRELLDDVSKERVHSWKDMQPYIDDKRFKEKSDYEQVRSAIEYFLYRDTGAGIPEACFDLWSAYPGCRVPFRGSLSHRSGGGTEIALVNRGQELRVHGLPKPRQAGNNRWMPEPLSGDDSESEIWVPAGSDLGKLLSSENRLCDFAANAPYVELFITEMWPDQQLDRDKDGFINDDFSGDEDAFVTVFERLFDDGRRTPLDWWGLTCDASESVRTCDGVEPGYLTEVGQSCGESWTVEECRRRLTALQGLRYLPDLTGDELDEPEPEPKPDKGPEDGKRDEILRRNRERVTCTVRSSPEDTEFDIRCPWQPSRSGYFRIAAVAVWEIKHCLESKLECDLTDPDTVPYGKMGAMTVSEPLGLTVHSVRSEGRSVVTGDPDLGP